MKFEIKLQSGSVSAAHSVVVPSGLRAVSSGRGEFKVDGVALQVDWAEVEPGVYSLLVAGKSYVVSAQPKNAASSDARVTMGAHTIDAAARDWLAARRAPSSAAHPAPRDILAPMPGRIVRILALEGAAVAAGRGLLVIEAMKMQNEIRAPRAITVRKVYVREGEGVEAGARLVEIS
ncbi:MAG: biotin/lipoyl-containing protein [Terriglobia bacterium]